MVSGAVRRRALAGPLIAVLIMLLPLMLPTGARAEGDGAFPPLRTVQKDGASVALGLTGETRRVVLVFTVYRIAHYVEVGALPTVSLENVLEDGPAKALEIRFARTLGLERIREEFRKSIRRNARPGWLEQAQGSVAAFLATIDRDARAGDRLVFYWYEGGRILAEFNGEPAFAATDVVFAKLIWSIWFGEDPVCDRRALLDPGVAGRGP